MNAARTYQLGVVGEANYQPAIQRCSPGQCVEIIHEPDNPYDNLALAVVTQGGDTIGYVPRECWLQDAVHEQGKGCDATIKNIQAGAGGMLGVVLDVSLNTIGVGERAFRRSAAPRRSSRPKTTMIPAKSWLARLFNP